MVVLTCGSANAGWTLAFSASLSLSFQYALGISLCVVRLLIASSKGVSAPAGHPAVKPLLHEIASHDVVLLENNRRCCRLRRNCWFLGHLLQRRADSSRCLPSRFGSHGRSCTCTWLSFRTNRSHQVHCFWCADDSFTLDATQIPRKTRNSYRLSSCSVLKLDRFAVPVLVFRRFFGGNPSYVAPQWHMFTGVPATHPVPCQSGWSRVHSHARRNLHSLLQRSCQSVERLHSALHFAVCLAVAYWPRYTRWFSPGQAIFTACTNDFNDLSRPLFTVSFSHPKRSKAFSTSVVAWGWLDLCVLLPSCVLLDFATVVTSETKPSSDNELCDYNQLARMKYEGGKIRAAGGCPWWRWHQRLNRNLSNKIEKNMECASARAWGSEPSVSVMSLKKRAAGCSVRRPRQQTTTRSAGRVLGCSFLPFSPPFLGLHALSTSNQRGEIQRVVRPTACHRSASVTLTSGLSQAKVVVDSSLRAYVSCIAKDETKDKRRCG